MMEDKEKNDSSEVIQEYGNVAREILEVCKEYDNNKKTNN